MSYSFNTVLPPASRARVPSYYSPRNLARDNDADVEEMEEQEQIEEKRYTKRSKQTRPGYTLNEPLERPASAHLPPRRSKNQMPNITRAATTPAPHTTPIYEESRSAGQQAKSPKTSSAQSGVGTAYASPELYKAQVAAGTATTTVVINQDTWQYGLCGCCETPGYALAAWCVPCISYGEIVAKANGIERNLERPLEMDTGACCIHWLLAITTGLSCILEL